eukprot:5136433-Pyramimonas_sp.AAC.1
MLTASVRHADRKWSSIKPCVDRRAGRFSDHCRRASRVKVAPPIQPTPPPTGGAPPAAAAPAASSRRGGASD